MLKCNSSHLWLLAEVGMGKEFDHALVTTLATQIELEGFFPLFFFFSLREVTSERGSTWEDGLVNIISVHYVTLWNNDWKYYAEKKKSY